MNENDKILINAYLDGETSEDESKFIESLLKSSNEANEFANNIKRANAEINSYFNSSQSKGSEIDLDTFIKKQTKKSFFSLNNLFNNPKYYAFAASAIFLSIILIPTSDNDQFKNLPVHLISLERDSSDLMDFDKIFNNVVLNYGDKSIWEFKIETDQTTLIIQISDLKDGCYMGTVHKDDDFEGSKEFKVCKEN